MRSKGKSLVWALAAASAVTSAGAEASDRHVVRGPVPLFFQTRPATNGSAGVVQGGTSAPVVIELMTPATEADIATLRTLGMAIDLGRDGRPLGGREVVLGRIPSSALAPIAAWKRVKSITADGDPFPPPPPLDVTAAEIQATDTWRTRTSDGVPLTGTGIIIGDVDSGIDVFHPLFFRADGGYFAWTDVNQNGVFEPGIDGIDLDDSGSVVTLRVQNSLVTNYFDSNPRFGSADPDYAVGMDWLYADANGDKERNFGSKAGFTEADPTYGERLFVADDINGNGKLDVGEKIVALKTSKIRAVRYKSKIYRRGTNLIALPLASGFDHGTGASGILVAGTRGLTRLVGIASDAELVMGIQDQGAEEVSLTSFCLSEGARVVLHEYAPWQGYHLDGSSQMEKLIDSSAATGVAHINPAGNLSTANKAYKNVLPSGVETVIPINAPADSPYGQFRYFGFSLLWRDVTRNLDVTIEDPTAFSMKVTTGATIETDWHDGLSIYADRLDSDRGTAKVDVMIYSNAANPPPIELGTWKVHVVDPFPAASPGIEVLSWVQDDLSGWGQGIQFMDHVNEEHLIGYPGTADHGNAVAAYTGHDFDGDKIGARAFYSGRGHRFDGVSILSIAGPDDPITSGYRDGTPALDVVFGGTSGASPHVAGTAALLIQADPKRKGDDVRTAIRKGAIVDADVVSPPNDDYGYGKLSTYRALYGKDPPVGEGPSITIATVSTVTGVATAVPIELTDSTEPVAMLTLDLDRDYDGTYEEALTAPTFSVTYPDVGTYYAKVRVTDSNGRSATALAEIDVAEPKPVTPKQATPPAAAPAPAEEDSGCSASPSAPGAPAWALLALFGIAAALRRRRS